MCFPVQCGDDNKPSADEPEDEKGSQASAEESDDDMAEESFYLVTPCVGNPIFPHNCVDINDLLNFGHLIWKSKTKKVVEGTLEG